MAWSRSKFSNDARENNARPRILSMKRVTTSVQFADRLPLGLAHGSFPLALSLSLRPQSVSGV
jgi:hypothetical protein